MYTLLGENGVCQAPEAGRRALSDGFRFQAASDRRVPFLRKSRTIARVKRRWPPTWTKSIGFNRSRRKIVAGDRSANAQVGDRVEVFVSNPLFKIVRRSARRMR